MRLTGLLGFAFLVSFNLNAAPQKFITDTAGFFSPEAVKSANEFVKELKKVHKKEVIIETVQKIPMTNEAAVMEGKDVDPLFSAWAKKRLSKAGTQNVYIVISKTPSFVMAAVGNETRSKGEFTENDRNLLIRILAENFQKRNYDKALIDSVRFVRAAIEANLRGTPIVAQAPPKPQNDPNSDVTFLWRWIGFGCAALLGLLLVSGLVKGLGKTATEAAKTVTEATKPPENTPA